MDISGFGACPVLDTGVKSDADLPEESLRFENDNIGTEFAMNIPHIDRYLCGFFVIHLIIMSSSNPICINLLEDSIIVIEPPRSLP